MTTDRSGRGPQTGLQRVASQRSASIQSPTPRSLRERPRCSNRSRSGRNERRSTDAAQPVASPSRSHAASSLIQASTTKGQDVSSKPGAVQSPCTRSRPTCRFALNGCRSVSYRASRARRDLRRASAAIQAAAVALSAPRRTRTRDPSRSAHYCRLFSSAWYSYSFEAKRFAPRCSVSDQARPNPPSSPPPPLPTRRRTPRQPRKKGQRPLLPAVVAQSENDCGSRPRRTTRGP